MGVTPSGSAAVKVATAPSPFSAKFLSAGPDISGASSTLPTVTLTIRSPVSLPTEAPTVTWYTLSPSALAFASKSGPDAKDRTAGLPVIWNLDASGPVSE